MLLSDSKLDLKSAKVARHGYSLAELDHEEALVEVGAAVGAADEVLLLVALVLAQRPLRLRAELEVLRLDICGGGGKATI